jgi:hypothetical protein
MYSFLNLTDGEDANTPIPMTEQYEKRKIDGEQG